MKTRLYLPSDYPTVAAWFTQHQGHAVPESLLPPVGVVVEQDGKPLAAVWLYQAIGVGVCWLAWLVSNPEVNMFRLTLALETLLGGAEAVARDLKCDVGFTMTDRDSLGRFLRQNGYRANHRGMTQFFKQL